MLEFEIFLKNRIFGCENIIFNFGGSYSNFKIEIHFSISFNLFFIEIRLFCEKMYKIY